jgi:hypothetical protein
MPESRQRFSTGNGPPGSSPGGPTQNALYDAGQSISFLKMVNNLYEKQVSVSTGTIFTGNLVTHSAMVSIFESHRLNCRRGMHERPDIEVKLYQSRTRLPANKQIKTRDLRHGCRRSVTTNNPIMEE